MNDTVTLHHWVAKRVYNLIVNSEDFRDGWIALATEDITALRYYAASIGEDPWEITPRRARQRYRHSSTYVHGVGFDTCADCGLPANDTIHFPADRDAP